MEIKPLIAPILATLALIFAIAGAATPFITYDVTGGDTVIGIIEYCGYSGGVRICSNAKFPCEGQQQARDALAAFAILSCLVLGLGAIWGIARNFVPSLNRGPLRFVFAVSLGVGILFAFFCWALAFALWDSEWCGSRPKDTNNARVGALGPLFLVCDVLAIVAIICEFVIGSTGGMDQSSDAKNDNQ